MGPPSSRLAGADEHIRWSRGELRIKISEAVVFMQVIGHLDKGVVTNITQPIDALIKAGSRPTIFNEWWELSGYDSEARIALTSWVFDLRGKLAGDHILVRSKIVSMGVSVANLALGGMLTVYTDRQAFNLAHLRAVRQATDPSSISPDSQRDSQRAKRT